MPSGADSARLARLGLLLALAAAVQVLEAVLPSPAPWFRLGLGNALVLVALHLWGLREGLWVALGKVLLGGLLTGRFLSPGFVLSLGGALTAAPTMALALRGSPPLGFVGVSVLGALAHAGAQLALASLLFLRTPAVWSLAPLFAVLAAGTGTLTGLVAARLAAAWEAEQGPTERPDPTANP